MISSKILTKFITLVVQKLGDIFDILLGYKKCEKVLKKVISYSEKPAFHSSCLSIRRYVNENIALIFGLI